VGLVADEPIWLAGMVSVFDSAPENGLPEMVPVTGTLQELLSGAAIEYLLLDLHSSSAAVEMLGFIRRTRPDLRILVIGPEGNDELVLDSIIAGARAYLDLTAGPEMVRTAISSVTEGSIWAPRRLLSKLIDRLLNGRDTSLTNRSPHLTGFLGGMETMRPGNPSFLLLRYNPASARDFPSSIEPIGFYPSRNAYRTTIQGKLR
jgi:DNA-binding NarL/FixJ family response regulator